LTLMLSGVRPDRIGIGKQIVIEVEVLSGFFEILFPGSYSLYPKSCDCLPRRVPPPGADNATRLTPWGLGEGERRRHVCITFRPGEGNHKPASHPGGGLGGNEIIGATMIYCARPAWCQQQEPDQKGRRFSSFSFIFDRRASINVLANPSNHNQTMPSTAPTQKGDFFAPDTLFNSQRASNRA
jgi:hypothetical protein